MGKYLAFTSGNDDFFLFVLCVKSMQAKHQSLLKRADTLYEECEELQELLGECEDKQADLLNQLKLTAEEKEQAHAQLSEQQVDGKPVPTRRFSSEWFVC